MIAVLRARALTIALVVVALLAAALIATRGTLARVRADDDAERVAHRETVALYRIAAADAQARAAERLIRVRRAQDHINQEIADDYQVRLADARARADALRVRGKPTAFDADAAGGGAVPALSDAAGRVDAAADDRFSVGQRLVATEQAIQLDALIAWVAAQTEIDGDADAGE